MPTGYGAGLGKLAAGLLAHPALSPGHALASLHLALTSIYAVPDEGADKEPNISAMEQLTHLFARFAVG